MMAVVIIIVNSILVMGGEGSGVFIAWMLLACALQTATACILADGSGAILGHPGDSLPCPPQVPKLPDTADSDS